jgi:hypothetical protein
MGLLSVYSSDSSDSSSTKRTISRQGNKWSQGEIDRLLVEVQSMEIDDIAKSHDRTPRAIRMRLVEEASKKF